jgi:hypothetical protein
MKQVIGWTLFIIVAICVLGLTLWGALALWFALPMDEPIRLALAALLALLGFGGLVISAARRRFIGPLLPFALACVALFGWWSTIEASNDRDWQPDVARLPAADLAGNLVTLHNVRDFSYRTATDVTEQWRERTVDLDTLETLDLFAVHWMGDDIAHTMLSFGFADGPPVTISIETRKEAGEAYSSLAGFFRRYELYYVVGTEEDLVGVRTTYREPPEDVYLFRVEIPKERIRDLFLHYLGEINRLNERPEFYNTATTNCTTAIVMNARALGATLPVNWQVLLSGHFPELLYERGALDQSLPYPELRRASLINDRANDATGTADFSQRIRQGLPGLP